MKTTQELIAEALQRFPKARKIAVSNFVGTAPSNPLDNAFNLDMDASLYKWNRDTVEAIRWALKQEKKIL